MDSALDEYLRVKSGQPRRRREKNRSNKQTVYIDGHTIGFQFNPGSMGSRTAHVKVHTEGDVQYCHYQGLKLKVQPITPGNTQHFDAVSQISQD